MSEAWFLGGSEWCQMLAAALLGYAVASLRNKTDIQRKKEGDEGAVGNVRVVHNQCDQGENSPSCQGYC